MALKLSVEVQAVTKDAIDRLDKLRAKLREVGAGGGFATKELDGVTGKLQALSSGVQTATSQLAAGGKRARDGLAPVSQQLGNIQGQLVALASGFSVFQAFRSFITATDQVSNLNAQLRLATKTSEEFAAAQSIVTDVANNFGVRIGDAAQSFARLSQAIAGLGGGLAEAAALTEALSAATKVSGVSAVEASASMIQFAQALGSGVLQGDELRSILENNRRLAKALADGLGVSVGALKKLGEEGKLTADVVAKAVISQLGQLRAEAELVPDTVERAGNRLFNAFATWVSASEQAGAAQANIIGLINALANNIDRIVIAAQIAGTAIAGMFAARAIQGIVAFVANLRTAITAISATGAGIALLSGPVGALVGLLTAAAAAFLLFKKNAEDSYAIANERADRYLETLEKQVAQQQKINGLRKEEGEETTNATTTLLAYIDQAKNLRSAINAIDARKAFPGKSQQVEDLLVQLVDVENKITRLAVAQKSAEQTKFFDGEAAKAKAYRSELAKAEEEFKSLSETLRTQEERDAELRRRLRESGEKALLNRSVIDEQVSRVGKKRTASSSDNSFRSALIAEEKASLEAETRLQSDAIQRQERALTESYERRAISAQEFFTQRRDLQLESIDIEIRQLTRLREIEEGIAAGPSSSSADRVRSGTEILRINRDIAIQTRRRGDVEQEAARDIVKANKEVQDSLEQVRFRLKELTGTATLDDIRKNALAGRKELFDSLAGDEQGQLDILKLVNIESVQTQLSNLQTQADQVLSSLAAKQEELSVSVQIGATSATDAENALNAERLRAADLLDELIEKMNALKDGNISAFGPAQLAAIKKYSDEIEKLKGVVNTTAKELQAAFQGPLAGLFTDLIKGTKSAKDAFEDFADAVVDALIRIAAQKAAEAVLNSVFGGAQQAGGTQQASGTNNTGQALQAVAAVASAFLAQGGMVRGPGTTTSDSIPAMLSKDEFVVKASTVKKVGPETMYALNSGNPKIIEALKTATQRFNTGGLVGEKRDSNYSMSAFRDTAMVSDSSERVSVLKSVRDALSRWSGRSESSAVQSVIVIDRGASESRQSASSSEIERAGRDVARESVSVERAVSSLKEVKDAVASAVRDSAVYRAGRDVFERLGWFERKTSSVVSSFADSRMVSQAGIPEPAPAVSQAPGQTAIHSAASTQGAASSHRSSDSLSVAVSASSALEKRISEAMSSESDRSTERVAEGRESDRTSDHAEKETRIAATFLRSLFGVMSDRVERVFNAPRAAVERLIEISRESREQRFSVGGVVRGPGTTTSDSIPARLSRDEFVVKAETVRKIGPSIMYALNAGHPKILNALRVASEGVANFATNISSPGVQTEFAGGGIVVPDPTVNNTTNRQSTVNFVVNTPDVSGITKNQTQITQELIRAMRAAGAKA